MQELEAKPASVWEILLYAKKEVLFIVAGVVRLIKKEFF